MKRNALRSLAITFAAAFLFSFSKGATFNVTAAGTNPTVDSAIAFTTSIWAKYLVSTVPIKVNIFYYDLTSAGPLGITFPNGRRDFASAPLDSIWYPTCLANAMEGSEVNAGEVDMDIYLNANSSLNWYFGTDGNPSVGQYDFVSVLLHEIGHGLGFLSLAKSASGNGSFGNLLSSDFFPVTTSFPWPDLKYKPSIYDYYLENTSGLRLADTANFTNPSSALHTQFTSNAVWFNAPKSFTSNDSIRVRIHAPSTYALGTSITHVHETVFPATHPSTLMSPFISKGEVNHDPGPLTLAILEDIGWTIVLPIGLEDETASLPAEVYPNPFTERLTAEFTGDGSEMQVTLTDLNGKILVRETVSPQAGQRFCWNLEGIRLPDGIYFLTVRSSSAHITRKVMHAGE